MLHRVFTHILQWFTRVPMPACVCVCMCVRAHVSFRLYKFLKKYLSLHVESLSRWWFCNRFPYITLHSSNALPKVTYRMYFQPPAAARARHTPYISFFVLKWGIIKSVHPVLMQSLKQQVWNSSNFLYILQLFREMHSFAFLPGVRWSEQWTVTPLMGDGSASGL